MYMYILAGSRSWSLSFYLELGPLIFLIKSLTLGDNHHQVQLSFAWHRACFGATLLFEQYPQNKYFNKLTQTQ